MNILHLSSIELQSFLLILIRVAGIFSGIPLLGGKNVPRQVKACLALLVTFIILPMVNLEGQILIPDIFSMMPLLAGEFMIGLIIGLIGKLIFAGIELAGEQIGFQMGFGVVTLIDPQSEVHVPIIGQFYGLLALMIFLGIDGHYYFISAIMKSFQLIPPLQANISPSIYDYLMGLTSGIFIIALKLGLPVSAVLLITNIILGFISKVIPQMNIFMVSVPLMIGIGLLLIGLSLPLFAMLARRILSGMEGDIIGALRLLRA